MAELEAKTNELNDTAARERAALSRAEAVETLSAKDNASLSSKAKELGSEKEAAQRENARLNGQLSSTKASLAEKNEALKVALEAQTRLTVENATLTRQLNETTSALKAEEAKSLELCNAAAEREAQLAAGAAQGDKLNEMLSEAKGEAERARAESERQRGERKQADERAADAERRATLAEKQAQGAREEATAATDNARQTRDLATQETQSAHAATKAAEAAAALAKTEVKESLEALRRKSEAMSRMEDKYNEAEKETERLRLQLREALDKVAALEIDPRQDAVREREKAMRNTVDKVKAAADAMEASLTCMHCMEVFRKPVTLLPCGHNLCRSCFDESAQDNDDGEGPFCRDCGPSFQGPPDVIPNEVLEQLCSRFVYQRQAVEALLKM
mmetsp:Transcript_11204/g.26102  ORF Transcript_11204/g.26102 Transcript_11204/m.26102 type:complete len:390 (+) Transcript_11204:315-1484(+)